MSDDEKDGARMSRGVAVVTGGSAGLGRAIVRSVELLRLLLAATYARDARTARSRGASPVIPALAAIRHAAQAAILLAVGPRWAHRVGRLVDALHAGTMGLLWMASPSHVRVAGRQVVGGLLMMQLEFLAARRQLRASPSVLRHTHRRRR